MTSTESDDYYHPNDIEIDTDHVDVTFEITKPADFGPRCGASIEVLNLLERHRIDDLAS